MAIQFDVEVIDMSEVYDTPQSWCEKDYHQLLEAMDMDGFETTQGNELTEMAVMALQDLEFEDAADAVLVYKLKNTVSMGVRQNIAQDFLEGGHPWEEYSDIALHHRLFEVGVLLYKAFPASCAKPQIIKLTLNIKSDQPEARNIFSKAPAPSFVARLLADGMDEDSILERLFENQLVSHTFPEAASVIWQSIYTDLKEDGKISANLVIYSSQHWLKAMGGIDIFQSKAYKDDNQ